MANTNVKSTRDLGKEGALPRTALLDEDFFASEIEQEPVASSDSSPAKQNAEGGVEVEQAVASFEGAPVHTRRQFIILVVLPADPEVPADSWEITHFHPTPKMSTYLLAWANGPFECVSREFALSCMTN